MLPCKHFVNIVSFLIFLTSSIHGNNVVNSGGTINWSLIPTISKERSSINTPKSMIYEPKNEGTLESRSIYTRSDNNDNFINNYHTIDESNSKTSHQYPVIITSRLAEIQDDAKLSENELYHQDSKSKLIKMHNHIDNKDEEEVDALVLSNNKTLSSEKVSDVSSGRFFTDTSDYDGDDSLKMKRAKKIKRKHYKIKRKHYKKFLLPLLLAYKLKFFTLVPLLLGGLVLLAGSTGLAGFFFALFAAVMGLKMGVGGEHS